MSTQFLGYRYLNSNIGYIKCPYFETTTAQNSLSQREIGLSWGTQYIDCSVTIARGDTTLRITGAEICGKTATNSGDDLKLGNSYIGATGGAIGGGRYLVGGIIIIKLNNGEYQLNTWGPSLSSEGGFTAPSTTQLGHFLSNATTSINVGEYYTSSYFDSDISNYLKNNPPIETLPTDPYDGAGDSTTGGGDGTFDGSSDPVPVPNLPSVGAQDSGFITLFAPTAQQMKDLAHFMWVNPVFDLSAFKKLFADPMDCILGLSVVPVTVPTSGAKNVNIGNLITTVTMNVASQQYIEVDCGTVTMDRFFGSYLDFEPYTKISLFLPYCGTHSLSMDDIAGKTIGIVYHIDILTGSCIAFVKCGDSVLYEFNGACGSNIPVNSLNFASTVENAIRIAVNIGTTVATAGASAPITTGANAAQREAVRQAQQKATKISLAGSTAEGALSMKPNVSRSGALGGGVGILGHQIPYFIITRPRLCKPAKQDFFQGYPSFIQTTIGDLIGKGFTSFTDVIISGQYLTDEEETELESILESGVYL